MIRLNGRILYGTAEHVANQSRAATKAAFRQTISPNKRAAILRGPYFIQRLNGLSNRPLALRQSIIAFRVESWKQDLGEAEFREIRDAHGIKLADQVIAFVLHNTRVKAFSQPFDR